MKRWIPIFLGLSVVWFAMSASRVKAADHGREEKVIIHVMDPSGRSIAGAELKYEQVTQDFMFSTGWRWRGDQISPRLLDRFNEIGFNTGHLLIYYMWQGAEPREGIFDWAEIDHAIETFGTTRSREELPNLRHLYICVGPAFGQLQAAPEWVNSEDLSIFQEQYGAFLRRFLERYRDRLEIYAVLHELEGTLNGLSREETLEWIKWETHLIRELDPEAVILIQTGDTHWYFPDQEEIDIGGVTAMPKGKLMQWLIDHGVDFDGFAVETHYSMAAPGDWHQMDEAIRSLTSYDKHVYIWETYYPSRYDPCLYFNWMDRALTPKTIPAAWPFPPETYIEAWQRDQILQSLRALIANPYVLGMNYGTLAGADFIDGFSDSPGFGFGQNLCDRRVETNLGLLRADYTPKPAFEALSDYWTSLFIAGESETDEEGAVEWIGMPGEYQITAEADGYEPRSMRIHVDQGHENAFQIQLQPNINSSAGLEVSGTQGASMVTSEKTLEEGPSPEIFLYLGTALILVVGLGLLLYLWKKRRI